MESILFKGNRIFLDGKIVQTTTKGYNFKYVGISKNLTKAPEWREVDKKNVLFYHWIYTFHYTDKSGGFTLLLDCYDKVSFGNIIT